jgi:hypothetical protein
MRTFIFISTLIFSFSSLLAQSAEEEMIRLKQQVDGVVLEEEEQAEDKEKPGHWNFSVGTSYSYMKGYGSGMMFYTAPTYTLALNDRWSLHGGVVASHYQGLNNTQQGEMLLPGSFSSLAIFASASYRMSDRLVLHGTGIKQLVSAPVTPFTPYPMDDFSLGATYKIGDNITIGASVHIRNGSGYNGYGGYGGYGGYSGYRVGYPASSFGNFGNPFHPSPFGW